MIKRFLAAMLALIATMAFAAVDVNKATQADLESIKGIGPAISGKILEERKKGSFKDWQDMIDRVKGVGEGNAAKFSGEGLTVNGAAFGGAPAKAAAPTAKKEDKPVVNASEAKKDAPPAASPAPAAKAETKAAPMSAEDKKAAAKKEKEDKKAAKAAAAEQAKKAKADKAAAAAAPASAVTKK